MSDWFEGELFPVGKEFVLAPVGAMARGGECRHDHVVAMLEHGSPPVTQGKCCLHCVDCEETWWEDVATIKGSPWAAR